MVDLLVNLLQTCSCHCSSSHFTWYFNHSKSGSFDLNFMDCERYKMITIVQRENNFWLRILWSKLLSGELYLKCQSSSKVKVLGWLVVHERVNTCEILQRRRENCCFSPHWCVLCKLNEENANHFFFFFISTYIYFWHCEVASYIWQKLYREAGWLGSPLLCLVKPICVW